MSGPLKQYHGNTHKAKVCFYDLAASTPSGDSDSVSMPGALDRSLYPPAKAAGAHVSSNSWGGSRSVYNQYARETDSYTYNNPDFLVLFAVGNEADMGCENKPNDPQCDAYTVLAPSTAKNIVAVGASQVLRRKGGKVELTGYRVGCFEKKGVFLFFPLFLVVFARGLVFFLFFVGATTKGGLLPIQITLSSPSQQDEAKTTLKTLKKVEAQHSCQWPPACWLGHP